MQSSDAKNESIGAENSVLINSTKVLTLHRALMKKKSIDFTYRALIKRKVLTLKIEL